MTQNLFYPTTCDTNFIYSIYLNLQFLNTVIIITNVHLLPSVICNLTRLWLSCMGHLGDNCIIFENFTPSIGDLMVANWVYWRRDSGASKRIFAIIKSTIDGVKFTNTIQLWFYSWRLHNRSLNILYRDWFLIEMVCCYRTNLSDMLCEKAKWNWLKTADMCKQMLFLGKFH